MMAGLNNKQNYSINNSTSSNSSSNSSNNADQDQDFEDQSENQQVVDIKPFNTANTASCGSSAKSSPSKSCPPKKDDSLVFDPKSLLIMLECPSCHLVPSAPPIFMCQNGHNICGDCRSVKCPQCHQNVTEARNFLAEGLLDKLKIKCPNAKDGCTELILIQNKKIHHALCHYRSIVCNQKQEKDCFNVQICYGNYLKHLKKVHKINGIKGTKLHVIQKGLSLLTALDIPMASEAWPINFMEAFGKTFITGTEIADEKIFWWISLFGSTEDAEKYIGKITLFNKNQDVETTYSGPVNEFRRSPAIILEEGTGLIATNSSFRPFTFIRMCDVGDPLENHMRWNIIFTVSERQQPYGFQFTMGDTSSPHSKSKSKNNSTPHKSSMLPKDCDNYQTKSNLL